MARIDLPFERDQEYSFANLRDFQSKLLINRKSDQVFSAEIRCNEGIWNDYNKEIVPISLLADAKRFRDSDTFKWAPEGHSADIVLGLSTGEVHCQITVADPKWPTSGRDRGSSYVRSLQMELLREQKWAFGGNCTSKRNGVIVSKPHARDAREDYAACFCGLVDALRRKQRYDGSGYALLIYAREFRFQLIDFDLSDLVCKAAEEVGEMRFGPLWVVDNDFFWERM